ncbi:MAG: alpha/beta hydrolase [Sphingobacterium sp.]|jgi:pimeloyl-ACP methyl ester carboxylesterase|nr:alpha/beta hydrolase [Sphingobacterium sp.]
MTGWSTSYCEVNNIIIHYTRTGGDKPPLILLHGLMTSGLCWIDLATALEKDYDIIMPDARGHGESSKSGHGYLYEHHANDIIGLIESLKLSPANLLGHSMGGMTVALASTYKPTLFRSVVLADPTFLTLEVQHQVYKSDVIDQHRKVLAMSLDELISSAQIRYPNRSKRTIETFAKARLQTSIHAFEVLTPPNPDFRELVRNITVPCLLLFGDRGIISSAVANELKDLNSLLESKQIFNAGHSLHLDQPDCFLSEVRSFLQSI